MIKKVAKSALLWSVFSTGLRFGGGILVLPLIAIKLPPEQVGLWFLMTAFTRIIPLFDLGFAHNLTRAIATAWAGAGSISKFGYDSESRSEGPNMLLLARLVATFIAFYAAIGLFLAIPVVVGGFFYFSNIPLVTLPRHELLVLWGIYGTSVALGFFGGVFPLLITGLNRVRESEQLFLVSVSGQYLISVVGLFFGWGLWSLIFGNVFLAASQRILGKILFKRYSGLNIVFRKDLVRLSLIRTLWPNSWRTGCVALGSYLLQSGPLFIIERILGTHLVGSFALTLQCLRAISQVCSLPIKVKIPTLIQLRIHGQVAVVRQIFRNRLFFSIIIYLLACLGLGFAGTPLLEILKAKTELLIGTSFFLACTLILFEMNTGLHIHLVLTTNRVPHWLYVLLTSIVALPAFAVGSGVGGVSGGLFAFLLVQGACLFWKPVQQAWMSLGE